MSDDYLWNRSGPSDPDVERLERMLGRLRSTPPVPDISRVRLEAGATPAIVRLKPDTTYVGVRFLAPALAAAAAIAMMVGVTWQSARRASSWEVAALTGEPRIEATAIAREGRITVGQTLTTDGASSARVEVGSIG